MKLCPVFFLCLLLLPGQVSWGRSATLSDSANSISNELNASPNDINQLLSTLEQENKSLIPNTPLTPYLQKFKTKKNKLHEDYGLNFGMSYTPLIEYSKLGQPHENASGGNYEFFGRYKPKSLQHSKTTFGIKLEDNHAYSTIPPGEFSGQINSAIKTVSGYIPFNLAVTELWLQQSLIPNKIAYRLGKIDLTSIMNSYAFDSRQFYYLSNVFTSHPATAVPSKALGGVLGVSLGPHLYSSIGAVDANGEETTSGFSTLHKGKFYTAVEMGYRDIITNPQSDNYHVFLWHVAAQPEKELLSDQGLSIVLQKNINSKFIPFIKGDWNRGHVTTFNKLIISGFGLQHPFLGSMGLWGLGAGWAELSEQQGVNQLIVETYYRLQLTPNSQLTPNLELIKALPVNQGQHLVTVFNLRYRFAA